MYGFLDSSQRKHIKFLDSSIIRPPAGKICTDSWILGFFSFPKKTCKILGFLDSSASQRNHVKFLDFLFLRFFSFTEKTCKNSWILRCFGLLLENYVQILGFLDSSASQKKHVKILGFFDSSASTT